jgi:hypothetical protein
MMCCSIAARTQAASRLMIAYGAVLGEHLAGALGRAAAGDREREPHEVAQGHLGVLEGGAEEVVPVPPLDSETPDCVYATSGMASIRSCRNWAPQSTEPATLASRRAGRLCEKTLCAGLPPQVPD